jgi:hydrogenase maturation factor
MTIDPTHCITCADEGIEMRIVAIGDESATCTDEHGKAHEVAIDLVQPVRSGDGVLVHAGVAIRHLGVLR